MKRLNVIDHVFRQLVFSKLLLVCTDLVDHEGKDKKES